MKKLRLLNLIGITFVALTFAGSAAGRGGGGGGGGFGGGGHFGGGGFAGGGHFGGGGFSSAPSFHGGSFGGVRYSFGARPMYGRPVSVRPQGRIAGSTMRSSPTFARQQTSVSTNNRPIAGSHSIARSTSNRPTELADNHVYARHDGNWHHDWDHRSAHYWSGHWWAWDGGAWLGLDAGFYPWDYYPYYAYDYYPYDYYPGYYADVEPYYSSDGVIDGVPAPDPTVQTIQQDLANQGYYLGTIDGLYGRATRDAVAHYQAAHQFTVTGTLTTQTLQSLGVQGLASN